ncbi:MAG: iron-sulfur cluster assembly accessory protein [candidate division Zixibacteria bacterium]|nr:iron-sulfur cluster assembly accessory protein [candidate division Zixibacteria bacterium]
MDQTTSTPAPGIDIPETTGPAIELTDKAAAEVLRLIEAEKLTGHFLRVGVQGGGCSGLQYSLNFETETDKFDKVYDIKGVKVVVDLKSALYLQGTTLDFVQSLTGGGFKFINPNASRSCGCGSSFSA